jgi:hemerythrin
MAAMQWSSALDLGVAEMDGTHREFVDHLNALEEAADAQMLACFDLLYEHTVAHFEQETGWMQQGVYPPLHCHQVEHDGVLQVMREVRGYLEEGKFEVGRVLAREVGEWFRAHAATMDAMLAQYLRQEMAQAPACGAGGCADHPGTQDAAEETESTEPAGARERATLS